MLKTQVDGRLESKRRKRGLLSRWKRLVEMLHVETGETGRNNSERDERVPLLGLYLHVGMLKMDPSVNCTVIASTEYPRNPLIDQSVHQPTMLINQTNHQRT